MNGYHRVENYNRLAYNSEFPWQADGKNGEVAMNYVVKNKKGNWEALCNFGFKNMRMVSTVERLGWRVMSLFVFNWRNCPFLMES